MESRHSSVEAKTEHRPAPVPAQPASDEAQADIARELFTSHAPPDSRQWPPSREGRARLVKQVQRTQGNRQVQRLLNRTAARIVQRCACGGEVTNAGGECEACRAQRVQREAQTPVVQKLAVQREKQSQQIQRLAVQRDGPAPAPPSDVQEREKKAFDDAKERVGKPAVRIYFNSANKTPRDTEEYSIEQIIERPAADPKRLGFDSAGPALAFASLNAGGQGAVVLQQDTFFFAARLKKGSHELRGRDAESTNVSTWQIVTSLGGAWLGAKIGQAILRAPVYKAEPAGGATITGAAARDGFTFPLNTELEPDADRLAKMGGPEIPIKPGGPVAQGGQPGAAVPADANDLRALAGIQAPGFDDKKDTPKTGDAVSMTPEQQDLFIGTYFRARGREALDENDKQVDKLAETFKPTTPGSPSAPGHGVSPAAQKMIDEARMLGTYYAQVLDNEGRHDAEIARFERLAEQLPEETHLGREVSPKLTVSGRTQTVDQWRAEMMLKKQSITSQKMLMLSMSPVLAQIAPREGQRYSTTQPRVGDVKAFAVGPDPYKDSLMGKKASPESDEEIRATFEKRLDDIRKALRHTRAQMVGEGLDFLLGMGGLQTLVRSDFQRIAGPNKAGLQNRLEDKIKAAKENKETVEIGEMVVLTALMFVPGGQLFSAVGGFALAADKMNDAFKMETASQASVDPNKALVDPQAAEKELAAATVDLALNSVFVALEANAALAALENGGRVPAAFAGSVAKPGLEPGVLASLPAEEGHTIKVTSLGVVMCSDPPCALLRMHYAEVLAAEKDGVLMGKMNKIDAMAATNPEGAAKLAQSLQRELVGIARKQRTAVVTEALRADPQVAHLLDLPGVGGDVSKLTGEPLLKGGEGAVSTDVIVERLKGALGQLNHTAGELAPKVLQVEGIEEFFKAACTSANPHTVEFELFGLVEQMKQFPNSKFRYQLPLGGRSGPDLLRYEGKTATVVQFKSFGASSDAVKDITAQIGSDLERLRQNNFMVPGPGGKGQVAVDQTMVYEIDWAQLKTKRPDADVKRLEIELEEGANNYLSALGHSDPAFTVNGKPFRVKINLL